MPTAPVLSRDKPIDPGRLEVTQSTRGFVRFLYSQNPFYLLSVCFVLHGTGIWYRANATTHSPWTLFGIITSYIVMMSGTGLVIVRRGSVWDDARSILLILFALFLELAMTADDVLISDRGAGRAMLLSAWLVAAGVTEVILVGLRIRLGVLYRVPLHLLLALIVLFPLVIVQGEYPHDGERITWVVFLFSPSAAVVLMTLIPAIRRGAAYTSANGTPWSWPLYPWSIFGFLSAIVLLRSYSLCLSFDPVMEIGWDRALDLENRFGGLYVTPLLLALSLLCIEWTCISGSASLRRTGLILPIAAVFMAIPSGSTSDDSLYVGFLDQIIAHVASPVWITMSMSLLIAGYAVFRRISLAENTFSVLLVVLAFLSPEALRPDLTAAPAIWPLALTSIIQLFAGFHRRSPTQAFAGQLCELVIVYRLLPDSFGLMSEVLLVYFLALGMILTGRSFHGAFATVLRVAGTVLLTAVCFVAPLALVSASQHQLPEATQTVVAVTMALFTATSIGLWALTRDPLLKRSACLNTGVTVPAALVKATLFLMKLPGGRGIVWGLGGILWFALAAWISSRKARAIAVTMDHSADRTPS